MTNRRWEIFCVQNTTVLLECQVPLSIILQNKKNRQPKLAPLIDSHSVRTKNTEMTAHGPMPKTSQRQSIVAS